MPGVVAAIRPRSTSGPSGTLRACTLQDRLAPGAVRAAGRRRGGRSGPGRSSAWSRTSGRFVAAITITLVDESKPSISVRIWFSVCSRSSLPPLNPATPGRARAADRVELVDEDDRRRRLLRLREEVAHARGADADDRLDELGRRHREEGHVRLARNGAREQRLARARRPGEQDAVRDPPAEPLVLLRIAEEVDDLGQLLLRLVDARDVGERDAVLRRLVAPRPRAAEPAEHVLHVAGAAHQPEEQEDEEDGRAEPEQQALPPRRPRVERLGVHDHALAAGGGATARLVGERRDLGAEARRRLRILRTSPSA